MPRQERRTPSRPTRRRGEVIQREPDRSRPVEEGESPYGGPLRRRDDPPGAPGRGADGVGDFSRLGGGTYYGGGSSHDTGSGALGRGGPGYEGEDTWGESRMEREEVTGPHAGRGPRSYRRSDESIREEICELLTQHPDVDAGSLEVLVEGGEVTLQGSVEDRDMRWLAQDLIESVSGVSLVHNRLKVSRR